MSKRPWQASAPSCGAARAAAVGGVGPLLRRGLRGVVAAQREVTEPWPLRCGAHAVPDELHGHVGQIPVQVVALGWTVRRVDILVVEDQVGIPGAGLGAEK